MRTPTFLYASLLFLKLTFSGSIPVSGAKLNQVAPKIVSQNASRQSGSRIYDEEICGDGSFTGVCVSTAECEARDGSNKGYCWSGDVCCKIVLQCNANDSSDPCVVRESGTIIMHETGMTNYRRTYRYRKPQCTCQLRLDFDEFLLAGPDNNGDCSTDLIQIGGLSLCGANAGQHAYFDFGESSTIDLSVRIQAGDNARFAIRNTYIPCDSKRRAPAHCLQYFTSLEGRVTSFNFVTSRADNLQINNFDYSICTEPAHGMNQIQVMFRRGQRGARTKMADNELGMMGFSG